MEQSKLRDTVGVGRYACLDRNPNFPFIRFLEYCDMGHSDSKLLHAFWVCSFHMDTVSHKPEAIALQIVLCVSI